MMFHHLTTAVLWIIVLSMQCSAEETPARRQVESLNDLERDSRIRQISNEDRMRITIEDQWITGMRRLERRDETMRTMITARERYTEFCIHHMKDNMTEEQDVRGEMVRKFETDIQEMMVRKTNMAGWPMRCEQIQGGSFQYSTKIRCNGKADIQTDYDPEILETQDVSSSILPFISCLNNLSITNPASNFLETIYKCPLDDMIMLKFKFPVRYQCWMGNKEVTSKHIVLLAEHPSLHLSMGAWSNTIQWIRLGRITRLDDVIAMAITQRLGNVSDEDTGNDQVRRLKEAIQELKKDREELE